METEDRISSMRFVVENTVGLEAFSGLTNRSPEDLYDLGIIDNIPLACRSSIGKVRDLMVGGLNLEHREGYGEQSFHTAEGVIVSISNRLPTLKYIGFPSYIDELTACETHVMFHPYDVDEPRNTYVELASTFERSLELLSDSGVQLYTSLYCYSQNICRLYCIK